MPNKLRALHKKLDDTIENNYRKEKFIDDDDRLKFLFNLYSITKNKEVLI